MSDAWFSSKVTPHGDTEDGCHPDEAEALKKYLRHELRAPEAAHAITQPITQSTDPNSDLPRLYSLLIDALIELPTEHLSPMLTLIQAIEALPVPDFSAVEQRHLPAHGTLWRHLPGFGHAYADEHQSSVWRQEALQVSCADERNRLRDRQIRKAEVEARLAIAGLAGIPIDWGYEAVADGLEGSGDELADFGILAAAKWLQIAAGRFWEGVERKEESWALRRKRKLWNGGDRMTRERFRFWETRLGEVGDLDGEGIAAATEAMRLVNADGGTVVSK